MELKSDINHFLKFQYRDSYILKFLKKYAKFDYVYTVIKPGHTILKKSDWFENMPEEILKKASQKEIYIILDFNYEGFGNSDACPLYDSFYYTLKKYNIPPSQLIYISANLIEKQSLDNYCKKNKKTPFIACSFSAFEFHTQILCDQYIHDLTLDTAKKTFSNDFNNKYYCSFSKVNRSWRTYASWKLHTSDIGADGYISHDVIKAVSHTPSIINSKHHKRWLKWIKCLPLLVDTKNFLNPEMTILRKTNVLEHTGFHIVNESFVEEENTVFFTEKTFKSMLLYQPLIIWGQPNCNHYLKELGYKLYDDWFDLSFDLEKDHHRRHKLLLDSIRKLVHNLKNKNRNEVIDWRFKNKEVLEYNKNKLLSYKLENSQLMKTVEELNGSVAESGLRR